MGHLENLIAEIQQRRKLTSASIRLQSKNLNLVLID